MVLSYFRNSRIASIKFFANCFKPFLFRFKPFLPNMFFSTFALMSFLYLTVAAALLKFSRNLQEKTVKKETGTAWTIPEYGFSQTRISRTRTISKILFLYGKIRVWDSRYSGLFYTARKLKGLCCGYFPIHFVELCGIDPL